MYTEISKDFDFSASHQLTGLPQNHQCTRLHGHNYRVRLSIIGDIIAPGFVIDYGELSFFKIWIDQNLDHRHLNQIMDDNPTAENLAAWLASIVVDRFLDKTENKNIHAIKVAVSETPKTWAIATLSLDHRHKEEGK